MDNANTENVREAFGKVLRQKRKERGWSQEELAGQAGIAMRYVSLLECNKRQPTISTMYVICEALNMTMSDFMGLIEFEMPEKVKKVG